MTLCLAWRIKNEISLMADSRLTSDLSIVTNNANKIFTIHVNIFRGTVQKRQSIFSAKYGLCFAGSYLNGSYLANTISELTSEIFVDENFEPTYDVICEVAFFVYENVTKHLGEIHREDGFSEAFFIGSCPKSGISEITKFSVSIVDELRFYMTKVLLNDNIEYLGSANAINKAREIANKIDQNFNHFDLMSEIIQDSKIVDVGGCIQYGCILGGNFRIYGIYDVEEHLNEENNMKEYRGIRLFRSLPMNWEDSRIKQLNCKIGIISMAPFSEKMQELNKQNRKK